MKSAAKLTRRSSAAKHLSVTRIKTGAAAARPAPLIVPLKDRRLNFGSKWEYSPAPEDSKIYVIAPRHELFINGKFVAPSSG
jgi:hypothetical protein